MRKRCLAGKSYRFTGTCQVKFLMMVILIPLLTDPQADKNLDKDNIFKKFPRMKLQEMRMK